MELLPLLGYFSAILIGLSLGLIGGGGSILTIPVLVYLFGIEPVQATAYSLFVVGVSSMVGSVSYMRRGLLSYRTAAVFALPSFFAVYITRRYLMPGMPEVLFRVGPYDFTDDLAFALVLVGALMVTALVLIRKSTKANPKVGKILLLMVPAAAMVFVMRQFVIPSLPEHLIETSGFVLTRDDAIMGLFSLVMLLAGISMVKKPEPAPMAGGLVPDGYTGKAPSYLWISLEGALVGTVTGIVGAGGGFLIIPALVLLAKLPMKLAVGTSLLIITVKSLVGFLGDVTQRAMDWGFLLSFSGLAVVGIVVGAYLSEYIPAEKLKKGFGWFVLVMSVVIGLTEIFS